MGNIGNIIPSGVGSITQPLGQSTGLLGASPPGSSSNSASEDLILVVGNSQISGWESVRITRGIERLPSDFDIKLTEKYPGAVANVVIQPGMTCTLKIGQTQILAGYVDRYMPEIDPEGHNIRITGRSKCQDIVDCSAIWPTGQIVSTNALDIARKLAAPYRIQVNTLPTQSDIFPLPQVPQQMLIYTESAADIIARSCRHSGLLFYDDVNGDLVLARVGTVKAACGFKEGVNVQRAAGTFTLDQRFSFMGVRLQSLSYMTDAGNPSSVLYPPTGEPVITYGKDGSVEYSNYYIADPLGRTGRFRNKNLLSEYSLQLVNGQQYMKLLWDWEVKRRYGRSFSVDITTDSWKDSAGVLWTPNTLVDIEIPSIRLLNKVTYIISEVTYMRDEDNGTTCRIVAMPPDAFNIQPIVLLPLQPDAGALNPGSPLQVPAQTNSGVKATQSNPAAITATSPQPNSLPSLSSPNDPTDLTSILYSEKGK